MEKAGEMEREMRRPGKRKGRIEEIEGGKVQRRVDAERGSMWADEGAQVGERAKGETWEEMKKEKERERAREEGAER